MPGEAEKGTPVRSAYHIFHYGNPIVNAPGGTVDENSCNQHIKWDLNRVVEIEQVNVTGNAKYSCE